MENLSNLVKMRLPKHHLSVSAKASEVLFVANQWLSEQLDLEDSGVKAYKLHHGRLYIAAPDAAFRNEVWSLQSALLGELQARFGSVLVQKVVLKGLTINSPIG